MPRISRGCQRCRQRRVKCDETRPTCRRCMTRGELCVGWKDDADLFFRHETEKVTLRLGGAVKGSGGPDTVRIGDTSSVSTSSSSMSQRSGHSRSLSIDSASPRGSLGTRVTTPGDCQQDSAPESGDADRSADDRAVERFFGKYVLYPCRETSTPGFLEHLPSLFHDVNVNGRYALRLAVQAAALADASREEPSLAGRALECYGQALAALGRSLGEKGKEPDDHDLMTVVMLDIFETLYLPDASKGAHAQGMAHILRLRGHKQFYSPRGWGLFRLAHHRLQKQQLAFQLRPMPESEGFLENMGEATTFDRLERNALGISKTCERGRSLMKKLKDDESTASAREVLDLIREMHDVDRDSVSWRQGEAWKFRTVPRSDIIGEPSVICTFPDSIELHPDVWNAYEWNYHRAARIILHEQLLTCLHRLSASEDFASSPDAAILSPLECESITIIRSLAEKILATVPQMFGEIDHEGRVAEKPAYANEGQGCRAIGSYFLLWPIKILKGPQCSVSDEQRRAAKAVFDRIRDYTGMKAELGDLSMI